RLFSWLRPFAQTTTYFGVAMIAVIWVGAFFLASEKHDYAYENALRQANNLTRIFAEYIGRLINATDNQLLGLQELYQKNYAGADLIHWINEAKSRNDLAAQFALAGADGYVKFSSVGRIEAPVYIGDREHFRIHANAKSNQLFIS